MEGHTSPARSPASACSAPHLPCPDPAPRRAQTPDHRSISSTHPAPSTGHRCPDPSVALQGPSWGWVLGAHEAGFFFHFCGWPGHLTGQVRQLPSQGWHSDHVRAQSCLTLSDPGDCMQPARRLCPRGFPRQEYWSELPYPPPGDLLNSGIEPRSPTLQADSLLSEPLGKPKNTGVGSLIRALGIPCVCVYAKMLL